MSSQAITSASFKMRSARSGNVFEIADGRRDHVQAVPLPSSAVFVFTFVSVSRPFGAFDSLGSLAHAPRSVRACSEGPQACYYFLLSNVREEFSHCRYTSTSASNAAIVLRRSRASRLRRPRSVRNAAPRPNGCHRAGDSIQRSGWYVTDYAGKKSDVRCEREVRRRLGVKAPGKSCRFEVLRIEVDRYEVFRIENFRSKSSSEKGSSKKKK